MQATHARRTVAVHGAAEAGEAAVVLAAGVRGRRARIRVTEMRSQYEGEVSTDSVEPQHDHERA